LFAPTEGPSARLAHGATDGEKVGQRNIPRFFASPLVSSGAPAPPQEIDLLMNSTSTPSNIILPTRSTCLNQYSSAPASKSETSSRSCSPPPPPAPVCVPPSLPPPLAPPRLASSLGRAPSCRASLRLLVSSKLLDVVISNSMRAAAREEARARLPTGRSSRTVGAHPSFLG